MKESLLVVDIGGVLVSLEKEKQSAYLQRTGKTEHYKNLSEEIFDRRQAIQRGVLSFDNYSTWLIQTQLFHDKSEVSFFENLSIGNGLLKNIEYIKQIKGYSKTIILSNTHECHWDYLRTRFNFHRMFDDIYLSFEIGLMKPDSAIFKHVLESERVCASQCTLIDDTLENIQSARACGMTAVHVTSDDRWMDSLRSPF